VFDQEPLVDSDGEGLAQIDAQLFEEISSEEYDDDDDDDDDDDVELPAMNGD
jgi:hypothetical protein